MENVKNLGKRIYQMFNSPSEGFKELMDNPIHSSISFSLGFGIFCLIFYILLQVPTLLSSIFIHDMASAFIFPIVYLIIFGLVAILFSIIILNFLIGNLIRRRIQNKKAMMKEKTKVLNIYVFSLTPYIMFLTQIPFIIIFGGNYNLFFLNFFIIGLFIGLSAWHFVLFYKGLIISLKTKKAARNVLIIYLTILSTLVILITYVINFNGLSISILGYLFG